MAQKIVVPDLESAQSFAQLVQQMRAAQENYFAHGRQRTDLRAARAFEERVDKQLEAWGSGALEFNTEKVGDATYEPRTEVEGDTLEEPS